MITETKSIRKKTSKSTSPKAKISPQPREKLIEKSILIYLSTIPECFAWKNNSTGVYDPVKKVFRRPISPFLINGVSDIIGIYKRHPLYIEVKAPGKEKDVSVNQKVFLTKVAQMGAIAFVASSVEQVESELKKAFE